MPAILNARLSLTSLPIMSGDATSSELHYTDGMGVDIVFSLSELAIGSYDVFQANETLSVNTFDQNRPRADYVGSINLSVAGQLIVDFSEDFDRKWEVYNAYNKRPIFLRVITQERDFQYCPVNEYPAWQSWNNNPLNRATIFTGDPEAVEIRYLQQIFLDSLSGSYGILTAVGWNGVSQGKWGGGTQDATSFAGGLTNVAEYANPAALGMNVATMFVAAAVNSVSRASRIESAAGPIWGYNADANVLMSVKYQG
jgi:hypothetical protein